MGSPSFNPSYNYVVSILWVGWVEQRETHQGLRVEIEIFHVGWVDPGCSEGETHQGHNNNG